MNVESHQLFCSRDAHHRLPARRTRVQRLDPTPCHGPGWPMRRSTTPLHDDPFISSSPFEASEPALFDARQPMRPPSTWSTWMRMRASVKFDLAPVREPHNATCEALFDKLFHPTWGIISTAQKHTVCECYPCACVAAGFSLKPCIQERSICARGVDANSEIPCFYLPPGPGSVLMLAS